MFHICVCRLVAFTLTTLDPSAKGRRLPSSRGQRRRRQDSAVPSHGRLTSSWSQGDAHLSWSLSLTGQNFNHIPTYVFQRVNLRDLQLSDNVITAIPRDIALLENLHVLKVNSNKIEEIPFDLAYLKRLQLLDISNNVVSALDDQLMFPKSLLEAQLGGNKIKILPEKLFSSCRFLRVFDCSSNSLVKLPSSLLEGLSYVE